MIANVKDVPKVLRKAVVVLKDYDIKYGICGGLAVNHYGLSRFTAGVDIVVKDIPAAKSALKKNGFKDLEDKELEAVVDRRTGVKIDLLKSGTTANTNKCVLFPEPIPFNGL